MALQARFGRRDGGSECLAACPVDERDGAVFLDVSALSSRAQAPSATRTLDDLPGPKGLPLLGNLHQLDLPKLHLILEAWAERYGEAYLFRMGTRPAVAIANPAWCEQVLRARPDTFRRDAGMAKVIAEMGFDGVFSAEGEAWRPQRKLSVAALAQRNLRGLYPKIQTVSNRFLARLRKLADAEAPVDIVAELKSFAVDVTTLITFGYDIDTIDQDEGIIQSQPRPRISRHRPPDVCANSDLEVHPASPGSTPRGRSPRAESLDRRIDRLRAGHPRQRAGSG